VEVGFSSHFLIVGFITEYYPANWVPVCARDEGFWACWMQVAWKWNWLKQFIVVPCCTLFQSLPYCSNSWNSLHSKTLKSHIKTLKIHPYMFRSPLKPSSGVPWSYFVMLLNWNIDLYSCNSNWVHLFLITRFTFSITPNIFRYIYFYSSSLLVSLLKEIQQLKVLPRFYDTKSTLDP
jgi:hypothetical protein